MACLLPDGDVLGLAEIEQAIFEDGEDRLPYLEYVKLD